LKSKVVFQNNGEVSSESDIVFNSRIRRVSEGLAPFYEKMLTERTSTENTLIIVNYILRLKTEINLSLNYKKMNITVLVYLCDFLCQKNIKQMKRENIISFLDRLRKSETSDPLHKWIGTYNLYRVLLIRFFRWFYSPDVEQNKRLKPSVIANIPPLKRKEQSIYKPTDLWTVEDDLLFLKYCSNPRDRCYHSISRDLSCRPHKILNLRLKEVVFKTVGKYQYAEVLVNPNPDSEGSEGSSDGFDNFKNDIEGEEKKTNTLSEPSQPSPFLKCPKCNFKNNRQEEVEHHFRLTHKDDD